MLNSRSQISCVDFLTIPMAADDDDGFLSLIKRKITKTPCLRDSLISGITGGFFAGFGAFILTSTQIKAINWGFGTCISLMAFQFTGCKLKRREQENLQKVLKEGIKETLLREGTAKANPDSTTYILTETQGHVPLDELEEFERRARDRKALIAQGPASPPPPPPPADAPTQSNPPCDCS